MNRLGSIGMALAVLALLAVAPLAGAAESALSFTVEVEGYNVTLMVPAFNDTVSLTAGGTYSINVSALLPENWTPADVGAIHIVASNVSGEIQLSAMAGNETVASATIVPLSSTYHQTLPPNVDEIQLSASQEAEATIIVYLESTELEFKLVPEKSEVSLAPGGEEFIGLQIEQISGPRVYIWFFAQATQPLVAAVYKSYPGDPWDKTGARLTTGPGYEDTASLRIAWPEGNIYEGQDKVEVRVYLWASDQPPGTGPIPESAQLVAEVSLTGSIIDNVAHITTDTNTKWMSLGIGALAAFALAFVLLGGGKKGRRGTANGMAPVILILVVLAAIGLTAGLIDLNPHVDIDAKYLGIGILAVLALIMLIRQGAVPAPRPIKKMFR